MKKILLFAALLLFVSAASADYFKLVDEEVCYVYVKPYPEVGSYTECVIEKKRVPVAASEIVADEPEPVVEYEAFDEYQYDTSYLVPKYDEPVYSWPRWYWWVVDFWWYCVIVQ